VTAAAFAAFVKLRSTFVSKVGRWGRELPELAALQDELRRSLGYDDYRIETPIVFNEALNDIVPASEPALILVADNPGKMEQLTKNRRYLVGQSGRLAEGFFGRELGMDFRRDVIIVNKTPLHTPKTAELRKLLALAGTHGGSLSTRLAAVFAESQAEMAALARGLHEVLGIPLWITGYGELAPRGLFRPWAEALGAAYTEAPTDLRDSVLLFRHFSMNQFAIDLKARRDPAKPLSEELGRIGRENRLRILGW
jgi:hypothetical protein